MNKLSYFLPSLLFITLLIQPVFAKEPIRLTGPKDLVLGVKVRALVLEAAREYLSEKNNDFLSLAENSVTPFTYEKPVVAVVSDASDEPAETAIINYDDASVLRVVALSFSKRVRGTLARGSTRLLQLKGGNMVMPGTSFPVSIPQAQGQTFTLTISEVTSDGYTLTLGEATQTLSLSSSEAGAAQFD